jgi:hypothetical protein
MSTGSALGGSIIPIAASNLIDIIGYVRIFCGNTTLFTSFSRFKWTMRVIALIELFMLAIANLVRIFVPSRVSFSHSITP